MSDGNPYYGGGGGFVPGGSGSPFGSQSSPGGGQKKARNQTLRPVTIKQIHDAHQPHPDADFQIDGHDVGLVEFVALVHSDTATSTSINYELGDGTGYVEVRQWLDSADDEAGKGDGATQDKYVMVIGNLKVFQNKRQITAQHLRVVEDPDEIHHHLLKALSVSLALRGGTSNGRGGAAPAPGGAGDYAAAVTTTNGVDYSHLPELHRKIMEVVSKVDHDDGMHVAALSKACGTAEGPDVMEAIETLMTEGLLFSTIDDLHVKAA